MLVFEGLQVLVTVILAALGGGVIAYKAAPFSYWLAFKRTGIDRVNEDRYLDQMIYFVMGNFMFFLAFMVALFVLEWGLGHVYTGGG